MASDPIKVTVSGKPLNKAIAAGQSRRLQRLANALVIATRLARHVRQRAQAGDFATEARNYGLSRPYLISEGYAEELGITRRGFKNSREFHQHVGRKPGNLTGGMWRGLQVRNFSVKGAVIEFARSSIGSRIKKNKRSTNQRVTAQNRFKSARVFKRLRINVLQPKQSEIGSVGAAITVVTGELTAFGGKTRVKDGPERSDQALARALARDIRAGRITRYL